MRLWPRPHFFSMITYTRTMARSASSEDMRCSAEVRPVRSRTHLPSSQTISGGMGRFDSLANLLTLAVPHPTPIAVSVAHYFL